MDIQAKIVEFYGDVANEISRRACADCKFYSTEHPICYNNMTSSGVDIQYLFNKLLNELDRYLMPDKHGIESEISVEDYYNGTSVLSLDKIINDVKKALKSEYRHCNHGADYNKLQSITNLIISRKINQMYIARIVYYKQNHRYYDKNLEQAYREIIANETANSNSVLTKATAKRIQTISRQITNSVVREVYDMVYNKNTVNDKYKISYGKMADIVNSETAVLLYPQTRATVSNNGSKYYIAVKNEILNAIQPPFSKFMHNIRSLVDENIDISNMPSDPYKTYEDFIKNKLGIVCILDYRNIKNQYSVLKDISVCSTIANEFAQYAVKTRQLFKNKKVNNRSQCSTGKKNQKAVYDIDSRFELVNSLDDLRVLSKMIELYIQVLALSMSEEDYATVMKARSKTDTEEMEIIYKIKI